MERGKGGKKEEKREGEAEGRWAQRILITRSCFLFMEMGVL